MENQDNPSEFTKRPIPMVISRVLCHWWNVFEHAFGLSFWDIKYLKPVGQEFLTYFCAMDSFWQTLLKTIFLNA